jgi:hypothetical protein
MYGPHCRDRRLRVGVDVPELHSRIELSDMNLPRALGRYADA